ncbi:MAG: BrnT family toxin [Spirochaetaceae bacterium]|nr:MAG: BrnT family toxin [Spirochaetaceae bacterium]TVQ22389.1 MAG: BrnT family toxin [Spirochaetaceae bacterium]
MEFEYDPLKSQSNQEKHGIDFEEAKLLWQDEDRIQFPVRSDTEERHVLLARKGDKVWAAIFTMRASAVRIISVRRARENEERAYYDS